MIPIIGCVVVLGAVLTGFMMAGGNLGALIHPSEFVTIGGAALGALIVMSPGKILMDVVRGVIQTIKGTPYNQQGYADLFKVLYGLCRIARPKRRHRPGTAHRQPARKQDFPDVSADRIEPSRNVVHLRGVHADSRGDRQARANCPPCWPLTSK